MSHQHDHAAGIEYTQEFWDDRYRSAGQLWSGRPNHQLVEQVCELPPGEALDAGCGEGADAIWLAARGWQVTAADVSAVALARAGRQAEVAGAQVAARISFRREDLFTWIPPEQAFDLVSAQFMHLPGPAFGAMFGRLAAAVRPGGTLLIVAHHADDPHIPVRYAEHPDMFPDAGQLAAGLDPARWRIAVAGAAERPVILDGQPDTAKDAVMRAVRRR